MNELKCTKCDRVFQKATGLGIHMRFVHGVMGASKGAVKYRHAKLERKEEKAKHTGGNPSQRTPGEFPCPHCEFIAKWRGGLTHHIQAAHKKSAMPKTHGKDAVEQQRSALAESSSHAKIVLHANNGHLQAAEDDRNHRLEAAATYAAGRVAQLLEGIALQHDLPPRTLAALVLRTVGATTQVR